MDFTTLAELEIADRCKVIMACATGKTRVGVELAVCRAARTVIVYVPSLALMRQTLRPWIESAACFADGMSYLCVCSDNTVAPVADSDEPTVTVEDIVAEFQLARKVVTTNCDDVREFLTLSGFNGVRVIFSTYQSSDVVRDGCPDGFQFDIGLFDEAHRTAGMGSAFSAPLLDSHTPINKRVFMTATPKHLNYRGRNKKHLEAVVEYSMDDEIVYGRTAYKLPIRESIKRGIIASYQVLVTVIDDKMIASDWNEGNVNGINAESIAHALAIRKAMEDYRVRKVVTFHDSVEDARLFAEDNIIQSELGTNMFHVNGSIQAGARGNIMAEFSSVQKGVVTNARCLTEGVDVPEIDMVAFLHPKKSQIDIIQAIGRALRLSAKNPTKVGYILLPLYVSQIDNGGFERALKKYGYDTVFQVIQALREQDEVVEQSLRNAVMRRAMGENGGIDFIKVSGPSIHIDMLRDAVSTHCIDELGEPWWVSYGHLNKFVAEHGHADVPYNFVTQDDVKLGAWCGRQRSAFMNGSLDADQIRALENVQMSWVRREKYDVTFEKHMVCLENFNAINGTSDVETRYVSEDGIKLGQWISNLRQAYKRGELSEDKIQRLKHVSFNFTYRDYIKLFESGYAALEKFFDANGHSDIHSNYLELDGVNLAEWARTQRRSYKEGKLSIERIERLKQLKFKFAVPSRKDKLRTHFESNVDLLKIYVAQFGNANVPSDYKTKNGITLGKWCTNQRTKKKNGWLSLEEIALLENVGFSWNTFDEKWRAYIKELENYVSVHGDCAVPNAYVTASGIKLGKWLGLQRVHMKKATLSDEKLANLSSLGVMIKR